MELFIGIGGAWVVGMAGWILLGGKKTNKHRCNVRNEVIHFRLLNNDISSVTKKKK